ncbi:hypothetical protein TNCV_2378261 [Trichonephila clavipes]|nr:hypothetical protein TNCV_2378261 [Trichonephila clavipes]
MPSTYPLYDLVWDPKPDFTGWGPNSLHYAAGPVVCPLVRLREERRTWQCCKSPSGKAEVIADSLQKQFEPNTEAENERFTAHTQRKIKRILDAPTCLDLEIQPQ